MSADLRADLVVIGAGAAGLWAAGAARRARDGAGASGRTEISASGRPTISLLDGRERIGVKILMSGGTRCNLTHAEVLPGDYRGSSPRRIARFLRAHPASEALRIFREELGLAVKEEPGGKLFPADDRAASVLEALLRGVAGVPLLSGSRWTGLERAGEGLWRISRRGPDGDAQPPLVARRVIVATGGCSYPRTGSDGSGLAILRRLGHTVVKPVPALSPFVLEGNLHVELQGIACPVRLTLRVNGRKTFETAGPMLWTHFGVSGPAVLDVSGVWARTRADNPEARLAVSASFLPDRDPQEEERAWIESAGRRSDLTIRRRYAALPARLLSALAELAGAEAALPLAQTPRETRRALIERLCAFPLPVRDVYGFGKAEVTSGGVPLDEVDDGLESRVAPGIHLAGEVLDVDGRLGGFNFQWAWTSGSAAGRAAVERLGTAPVD